MKFDTIKRLSSTPQSEIEFTDHAQAQYLSCAQGKQTSASKPKKDTGSSALTDCVGGVIRSDLKGPITPRDRRGNRYLVNFVDHKTNYCRIFSLKRRIKLPKDLKIFQFFFEKRYDCRVHVLRTDGGGEYKNVDLFWS